MSKVILLDTSAWLTWSQDEPGADEVEMYFEEALDGAATLHSSFVSLTELKYITTQKFGADKARELLESVEDKPVRWHQSDRALCSEAAKRLDATLVHKDPEFDALGGVIKLHGLPPKVRL